MAVNGNAIHTGAKCLLKIRCPYFRVSEQQGSTVYPFIHPIQDFPSDSGRLTFSKETAHSKDLLVLQVTNAHQITSQWLLFAKHLVLSKATSTCSFSFLLKWNLYGKKLKIRVTSVSTNLATTNSNRLLELTDCFSCIDTCIFKNKNGYCLQFLIEVVEHTESPI